MRILICDYAEDAKQTKATLENLMQKNSIHAETKIIESGKQFLFCMDSEIINADFIYLECSLPDESGVELAQKLRKKDPNIDIIFYTKDKKHMSKGYDVNALHYLVKGQVKQKKFEQVFMNAVDRANKREKETLSLVCAGENRKIEIGSISYFEINKRIVTAHYGSNEEFDFYSTLSHLEELLKAKGFLRIHQSYLVSEKYIRRKTKEMVLLADQTVLPIGRSFQRKMKQVI